MQQNVSDEAAAARANKRGGKGGKKGKGGGKKGGGKPPPKGTKLDPKQRAHATGKPGKIGRGSTRKHTKR